MVSSFAERRLRSLGGRSRRAPARARARERKSDGTGPLPGPRPRPHPFLLPPLFFPLTASDIPPPPRLPTHLAPRTPHIPLASHPFTMRLAARATAFALLLGAIIFGRPRRPPAATAPSPHLRPTQLTHRPPPPPLPPPPKNPQPPSRCLLTPSPSAPLAVPASESPGRILRRSSRSTPGISQSPSPPRPTPTRARRSSSRTTRPADMAAATCRPRALRRPWEACPT
jgi:hypothetical protein